MTTVSTPHHGHLTALVISSVSIVAFFCWFSAGYAVVQINIPQELILRWIRQTYCIRLYGIPEIPFSVTSNFSQFYDDPKVALWCKYLPSVSSQFRTNTVLSIIWGLIGSAPLLGGTPAGFIANALIPKLGFRKIFFIANVSCTIGAILSGLIATIVSYEVFIVGRLFIGIGYGLSTALTVSYIAEISPANHRGVLGAFPLAFFSVGTLLATIMGFPQVLGTASRWPYISWPLLAPCAAFFLFYPLLPESPRWQYRTTHNVDKTTAILQRLRNNTNVRPDMELIEAEDRRAQEQGAKVSIIGLFRDPFLRYITLICIAGVMAQRFTGFSPLCVYSYDIFQQCGLSTEIAIYGTTALVSVQAVAATVGALIIDKVGRRPLLLVGLSGCALTLTAIVILTTLFTYGLCDRCAYGSLVAMFMFMVCYACGPAIIPILLSAELFGMTSRESATTFIMVIIQGSTALIVGVFPIMRAHLLEWTFAIFAGGTIVLTLFLSKVTIETKGKTFLEIQAKLEKRYYGESVAKPQTVPSIS
ncbi:solute carrier family 2, facilitated glucose transporter member 5-like [Paramacrobiotus metropolitanus]|uniref:solute carrier family 2, facilitated glucose transporter member 5-like n=1 Tax=Paramacrobiotus metropolitanus TaxID=2943436 RepID=UPI00244608CC|nr:solute carrier family 2, facilitated glucose transporter member 5-like [Paramacrobiotus metropolitanus]